MGLFDEVKDLFGGEKVDTPVLPTVADDLNQAIGAVSSTSDARTGLALRDIERFLKFSEDFLPEIQGLINDSDPKASQVRDLLFTQIIDELKNPTAIDAGLRREIEQQIRGAQSARGTSFGNSAVSSEALGVGQFAENIRRNRQQIAQQILNTNAATNNNPLGTLFSVIGQPASSVSNANVLPTAINSASNRNLTQSQLDFNVDQVNSQRGPRALSNAVKIGTSLAASGVGIPGIF